MKSIEYRGQKYPVNLERGVVGNLSEEEIARYSKAVKFRTRHNIEGYNNNIFFEKDKAVRYSVWDECSKIRLTNECLRNYFIGNDLIFNDAGAPKMHGVYFGIESFQPFLVMNRLNLTNVKNQREFDKIQEIIIGLGYTPSWDTSAKRNIGYDKISKKIVCFDFDKFKSKFPIPQFNAIGQLVGGDLK